MTDHLRPIEVNDLEPQTLRDQPAPMLDWVKIADLRIDTRYQRPLERRNWAAIQRIAANFDWCAFGPILCAPIEGGLYAVIDGQHRAHAAAICGIERLPAMIVPVAAQKQALAFVQVNSGIIVNPYLTLRAELAAGEAEALTMRQTVERADCQLMTTNWSAKDKRPRQIFWIGTLRKMIRAGLGPSVTTALQAINAYDTKGRTPLYTDYIVGPLTRAIAESGVTDPAIVADALRIIDPFTAMAAADRAAENLSKQYATLRKDAFLRLILTARERSAA